MRFCVLGGQPVSSPSSSSRLSLSHLILCDRHRSLRLTSPRLLVINSVIAAIERLRQPADSKNDEEQIIRTGPEKAGLSNYLGSIKRLNKALGDMKASNLRSTQQTVADLQRLIKSGNTQLEYHYDKLLHGETPREIEPQHNITKNKTNPNKTQNKNTQKKHKNTNETGAYR